ncbi:MAG: hypothetical protein GSR78_00045 [Desulfurococcales archaeon]|nr:hypothetical protein [Desulfurococcales archaeon]
MLLAVPVSTLAAPGAGGDGIVVEPVVKGFKYRPSVKGGAVDIRSMAWSPDRPNVFVVGAERWIALVSASVGREQWTVQIPVRGWVWEVSWAGDLIVAVAAKRQVEDAWINIWETSLMAYTPRGELAWLHKYSGQPVMAVGQGLIAVAEMDAVDEGGKARMTDQRVVAYTLEGERAWSLDLGGSTVVLDAEWSPSGRYLAVKALVTDNPVSGEAAAAAYKVIVADSEGAITWEREYPASETRDMDVAWAREGDTLAVVTVGSGGFKLEFVNLDNGGIRRAALPVQAEEILWTIWAPSGEAWTAVSTGNGGRILLAAKPGTGEVLRLEPQGGVPKYKPKWSHDGMLAASLSEDTRYVELRDGRLNLILQAGPGFIVTNERSIDTLIQWIAGGEGFHRLIAKSGFNEVRLYRVNEFSIVRLNGSGLLYDLCLSAPGTASPTCIYQLGGTETLYLKPGSYTAEVKVINSESLEVYGPLGGITLTLDIQAGPFEWKSYNITEAFMGHVGTLEVVYTLPERLEFSLRILGEDGREYHKMLGIQGETEARSLKVRLVEGVYKVVAFTKVTGLPVKLEKEVNIKPGEASRIEVDMETLGIGKLVLLGGAVHTVTLSNGTEVYKADVARGERVLLYLPAGEYKVIVDVNIFLLEGIEILGPLEDLKYEERIQIKPAQETLVDPTRIIEKNLAKLKVYNEKDEDIILILVPFTEEEELVELANLIDLAPGESKEYFIIPGYKYKVIDQANEEIITEITPKPGESITITISKKGITQETQAPTQTETGTDMTTTGTEAGNATGTMQDAEEDESKSNTLLMAGVGIVILLILAMAISRRG